jgi:hypothetical protein
MSDPTNNIEMLIYLFHYTLNIFLFFLKFHMMVDDNIHCHLFWGAIVFLPLLQTPIVSLPSIFKVCGFPSVENEAIFCPTLLDELNSVK